MTGPDPIPETIAACLLAGRDRLRAVDCEAAGLEARALLAHACGRDVAWLFAHADELPPPVARSRFEELLTRRVRGEPLAYLLGHRGFWTLELRVGPEVLIPRFETELLVESALQRIAGDVARVLDLGTGSGAVILALKSERPDLDAWGMDRSVGAVAIARANARASGLEVHWFIGDWLAALGDAVRFDVIVANPPYIATCDPCLAAGDLRFEPRTALVAAEGGLADLRRIIQDARGHLEPGGWLLVEHGWNQGEAVRRLLRLHGFCEVSTKQDLAGHPRVTEGCWPLTGFASVTGHPATLNPGTAIPPQPCVPAPAADSSVTGKTSSQPLP